MALCARITSSKPQSFAPSVSHPLGCCVCSVPSRSELLEPIHRSSQAARPCQSHSFAAFPYPAAHVSPPLSASARRLCSGAVQPPGAVILPGRFRSSPAVRPLSHPQGPRSTASAARVIQSYCMASTVLLQEDLAVREGACDDAPSAGARGEVTLHGGVTPAASLPSTCNAEETSIECPRPMEATGGAGQEGTACSGTLDCTAATATDSIRDAPADQPHADDGRGQTAQQSHDAKSSSRTKPKSKSKSKPRLTKMEDPDELEELLAGVYDNEEELVSKLMQQLQGLSHKQQRLYGIWDGTPDGGKRAFVEQWRRRHEQRRAMVAALRDPARPPAERMALRTSYILRWRKILFSCPNCWLLPGLCVCGRMQSFSPQRTKVVVHAHHGEWGSASNSGCILPTSLEGSEILLYSHPDHDARLREILDDPSRTTALLWPGSDSLLPDQLRAIAEERTGGRITVVALDATWGNARRMQGWFPRGTLTVRLPPESTLKENKLSLLRPVRRYRGDLESGRVSTVEAVASLLYELEGDEAMYRGLLENLKIKVDACRLQKNRTLVYDTHAPEPSSASVRRRRRGQNAHHQGVSGGGGGSGCDDDSSGGGDDENGADSGLLGSRQEGGQPGGTSGGTVEADDYTVDATTTQLAAV